MVSASSYEDNLAKAKQLRFQTNAYIGGKFIAAVSAKTFDTVSPIDGTVLGHVAECDAADVDLAVASARKAFDSGVWRNMAPARRKAIMLRWAEMMERHAEELALLDV